MAVAVALPQTAIDPPCCARLCDYSPSRVAFIIRMLDELAQSGYEPSEALMTILEPSGSPYERRSSAFGPSEPTGAKIVADIHSALLAGHRDPVSIGRYLCPWSSPDVEL